MAPPCILDGDGFYHVKIALMLKEGKIIQDFPWTQFTTYKDLFVDHHLGYHWLLVPFLSLPTPSNLDAFSAEIDPLIKAKLATTFFAALIFVIIYWFFRFLKTKKSLIWTLLCFLVPVFLVRLSFVRAPAISVGILILGYYLILKKKYLLLFLLSYLYVLTHGAWPLIIVVTVIYGLAGSLKYLINHLYILKLKSENKKINIFTFCFSHLWRGFFKKNNLKLIFSCILGSTAGLILNPYFPKTLPFYWFQTVKIAILNYQSKIGVGAEWYPYPMDSLVFFNLPIFIPLVISIAWFLTFIKKQRRTVWFFFLLSVFFFLYTLKSRRNVEYFIPVAIFFSALIFNQIIKKINWLKIKTQIKKNFQGSNNIFYFIFTVFFIILSGYFLINYIDQSIYQLRRSELDDPSINHLQRASGWLKQNSQPQEIVFQSNWDIFPQLFYFNNQNYYINGLDQTFMYEKDKDLYKIWLNLVSGRADPQTAAQIIKEKFHASYILLDKQDKEFANLLKKSKLEKTYEDDEAIIYRVGVISPTMQSPSL
ncbi:MAG: hypothetical protein PHE59_02945 [Patescibacteria group bacterium]|nr:hypothetical protein [Patescibacteria group bacterium]MDD5164123.1 hypothetical protein [Patescibacteria group bacterium]MDD5534219.1 hypothetical protein [Patescibacteria group bacterium]